MDKEYFDLFLQQINQQNINLKADLREEIKLLKNDLNQGFQKYATKFDHTDDRINDLYVFKWKIIGIAMGVVAFIEIVSRGIEFVFKLLKGV